MTKLFSLRDSSGHAKSASFLLKAVHGALLLLVTLTTGCGGDVPKMEGQPSSSLAGTGVGPEVPAGQKPPIPTFRCRNATLNEAFAVQVVLPFGHELECEATTFNDQLKGYNLELNSNTFDQPQLLGPNNGWTYLGDGKYHFAPRQGPLVNQDTPFRVFVIDTHGQTAFLDIVFKASK